MVMKNGLTLINGDNIDYKEQVSELSQLAGAQDLKIKQLQGDIKEKDQEIVKLKQMLMNFVPDITGNIVTEMDRAEMICRAQIDRLEQRSQNGELSLEDVKKLDLLVKNQRLTEGKSTMNADYVKLPENATKKQLLNIATTPMKKKDG